MNPTVRRSGASDFLYDAERLPAPEDSLFEPAALAARGLQTGSAGGGRGTAVFFRHADTECVLRHYRRGGWLTGLVEDSYLWTGLERSRPWREWRLTAKLQAAGLPVPAPLAARVQRSFWRYRGDLVTERITPATSLHARLQREPLPAADWLRLGALLRRFHDFGLDHPDITSSNILCQDDGSFWLIDFDKAVLRRPGAWREANLRRFRRYLDKQCAAGSYAFTEADWQSLQAGYSAGAAGG